MSNIGNRVKALRQNRGITQTDLGGAVGLSFSAISAIEKGVSENPTTLDAIAEYFEVDKIWLRTGLGTAPQGIVIAKATKSDENPWKDALVMQLKAENQKLWEMVQHYMKSNPANFLKPTHNAQLRMSFLNDEVGQAA